MLSLSQSQSMTIFLGHPLLSLTPGACCLIQCFNPVDVLVYTTGSMQQSWILDSTQRLNTPATVYLTTNAMT